MKPAITTNFKKCHENEQLFPFKQITRTLADAGHHIRTTIKLICLSTYTLTRFVASGLVPQAQPVDNSPAYKLMNRQPIHPPVNPCTRQPMQQPANRSTNRSVNRLDRLPNDPQFAWQSDHLSAHPPGSAYV